MKVRTMSVTMELETDKSVSAVKAWLSSTFLGEVKQISAQVIDATKAPRLLTAKPRPQRRKR